MPRGHALGMVSYLPEADKYDKTREVGLFLWFTLSENCTSRVPTLVIMAGCLPDAEKNSRLGDIYVKSLCGVCIRGSGLMTGKRWLSASLHLLTVQVASAGVLRPHRHGDGRQGGGGTHLWRRQGEQ